MVYAYKLKNGMGESLIIEDFTVTPEWSYTSDPAAVELFRVSSVAFIQAPSMLDAKLLTKSFDSRGKAEERRKLTKSAPPSESSLRKRRFKKI